jgi:hypothetical protein
LVLEVHQILQEIIQYLLVLLVQAEVLAADQAVVAEMDLRVAQAGAEPGALALANRGVPVLLGKARRAVEAAPPQQQTWGLVAAAGPVEPATMVLMCPLAVLVVLD